VSLYQDLEAMEPLERYRQATRQAVLYLDAGERLLSIRRQAVAELHAAGRSYRAIAELTGLTRSRVLQLVRAGEVAWKSA